MSSADDADEVHLQSMDDDRDDEASRTNRSVRSRADPTIPGDASVPDWMDRRGDWPPTPNRDRDRVTIPIAIPVRWGVSSDGRRVAVTGSGDPEASVAPAPALPSSPDLARRTAELIESCGSADSESSTEREASAMGDLDFIGLSNMLSSEMAGLGGAAWQAAEDLRQDCYYARAHDHRDARQRVAIALRARAAIKESTVLDAARRWALARRAHEDVMDEIERRQSENYVRPADALDLGRELLRHKDQVLEIVNQAYQEALLAMEALREAALAL